MYIKKYLLSSLTSTKDEIFGRMELIQKATGNQIVFEVKDDYILRKSKPIKGEKPKFLTEEQLSNLAKQMDYFSNLGLIHGDLHFKNLLVNNEEIYIIDWEPSLEQMIGNLNTLMYTGPWIDPEDKENRELTINTDLLCFYRLKTNKKLHYFKENDWFLLKNMAKNDKIPFTFLNKEQSNEYTNRQIKQERSF